MPTTPTTKLSPLRLTCAPSPIRWIFRLPPWAPTSSITSFSISKRVTAIIMLPPWPSWPAPPACLSRLVVGYASGSYDPANNRYVVTIEANATASVKNVLHRPRLGRLSLPPSPSSRPPEDSGDELPTGASPELLKPTLTRRSSIGRLS